MSEENRTSEGLEQSLDHGVDAGLAAKGAYDTAANIGAAAASTGQAAAEGAAAAGAGTGAAAGAGAAAGTAAGGPAGTVLGAAAGLAVGLLAKPVIKGVIVIVFFLVMVFSSLPSMFFEESVDMADNTGPVTVYQQFKDYVQEAYKQEIEKRKQEIETDFQRRIASGEFSGYDHVTYTYTFDPAEEVFLAEVREACVLIIAMFEIHTDDWREASFDHFKRAVDSVNFWNQIVETEKLSETSTVTWSDGGEGEEPESTIHVEMTYHFHDKGVEQFRKKFGLQEDREYLKSVEMAYNTRIYFGESADLPMGGVISGASGAYPGGGTHSTIRDALAGQEEQEFFGGPTGMPIRNYHSITSEFGPRNYAPDPIHTGIDFSADQGTPIYAAMDGIVLLRLTNMRSFGHHIVIDHGGGITTMYAHMSAFGSYEVGEEVKRGDIIGYVGSTGLSINHIQTIATNNAISRRFFAIFEFENPLPAYHPGEKEIRFALESAARNFRSYLSKCGNSTVEFTGEQEENEFLLQLFHTLLDHYNTEETTLQGKIDRAFKLRLAGNNLDEMCTADYACPDRLDFRHARYVVIDGVYHAYLHIPSSGYKTLVGAAWLSPLINAGEAIDVDLFLHKMPSDRMQVQVSRNLRINKAKISEVSTTSADYNKMGDIMESGYYLQRGLNDGQEFFYLNVLVTVKAFSKKDLENRVNEVIKMMTAKQITLKYCAYMQERAFLSTLPLAKLDHKLYQLGKRNVLTNTAASTYMFTSFEICDESGILLGTNEHNNSLVVLDLFNQRKYKNPHLTILGTTGSGKTHTLQCLATRMRRKHVATYVIAPLKGHEFVRAAKAIGGQFIRISTGSPHCINVMEIRPMDNSANELLDGEMEEQSYLSMKIDSLLIFFSIIMPEMTNIEEQLLDEALVKTYGDFGITNDNRTLWDEEKPGQFKTMPILGDLYENLKSNPKAERLAIVLNRFVNGSARSFNGPTNVSLSNPYTVIDLSYLKKKLLSAGMFIATDLIWDLARQNRLKQKAIVIDEVWQLIGSNSSSQAAEYLVEMAKIGRAYNTAIIFASQDINDFFSLEGGKYGKAIISNSKTKIVLNLEPHEAEKCGEVLNLTATELHKIKNFDRGHGLLSSNGNNIAVHFQASALENSLITTDPEELRRIAEEKQKEEQTDDETPPATI